MGGSGLRFRPLDKLKKGAFFDIKRIWTKKNFYSRWEVSQLYQ
jgi:hypothetical protein